MKIKICGIKTKADILKINLIKPDYIGFVFANSKRQISPLFAKELKEMINPNIKVVGVFVNENIDTIINIYKQKIIDIVQLHGNESNEDIIKLKNQNIKVIKAFKIEDINLINESLADYILLDSKNPGSGKKFNWSKIKEITKPFFLAGGINIKNINQAILIKPYGIDVSSGVENKDGFKSKTKMQNLVRRVKHE